MLFLGLALAVAAVSAQAMGYDVAAFVSQHQEALMGIGFLGTVTLPNGSLVAIANGYSNLPAAITAISNANPGVATSTAHGLANGDFVEMTSGWSRLTGKVVRVSGVTANTFNLEGIDTTLTSIYPTAGGAGTGRKVTGWTQLAQVLTTATNGGDQQFTTFQFLESDAEKRIPTTKSAAGLTLSVADDPLLPGYILAAAANDDRLPRGVRVTLPSASILLYNAYVSLNKTPSLTINEIMACEVTFSQLAEVVRY